MGRTTAALSAIVTAFVMVWTVVVLGAVPTAAAAAPTLALVGSASRVVYGDAVKITGSATPDGQTPAASALVSILARPAGSASFAPVATVLTDADGRFGLDARPETTTSYLAQWVGPTGPLVSAELVVEVSSVVTLSQTAQPWAREPATLGGQVLPARPAGTQVTLLVRSGAQWVAWQTATLDDQSRFTLSWTPPRSARMWLVATVVADTTNTAGSSQPLPVAILDPNPHHVPARLARVIVIDHSTYTLYYYVHGRWLRRFPCVLGDPSTPTPYGRFRIQRRKPHPGGPNGAYYLGYNGIIGIHGTNQPQLLRRFPRAYSHGCARLANADVTWLYAHTPLGTPVWNVR